MAANKCVLRCAEGSHDPIPLEDNTPVILGRGPLTKIKDSRCSRTQVLLVADYATNVVNVTQLGRNPCGLNGNAMKKDVALEATHGDKVDILLGQYKHVLEFIPPPNKDGKSAAPAKPAASNQPEKPVNAVSESDDEGEPLSKQARLSTPITASGSKSFPFTASCWESVDNGQLLIYTSKGVTKQQRIAAYDLDHTVITTTSGATFPKSHEDWHIMYPEVIVQLNNHRKNGFKVVIFTNQGGLKMFTSADAFKNKIEAVQAKLKVPLQAYIATGNSKYRKPCPYMWYAMVERNGGTVNLDDSFYCGDAAGREAGFDRKKPDFSQSDILFAQNVGIKFVIPEEHFLGKRSMPSRITAFNPRNLPTDLPLCEPEWGQVHSTRPELILLVGCQGSGKSHFVKTHLEPAGYVHINRDTLGSISKCLTAVENALKNKLHVVVDNTNPTLEAREKFIRLGKRFGTAVRAFVMNTSPAHAKHNLKYRNLTDPNHAEVNDTIISTYFRTYEEPTTAEGFAEIIKINFWFTSKDAENDKLYNMYLTDK